MFSPRDAFVVPVECVSAFAVVLQGRIRATFAFEEILAAAFQGRIPVVPDCVFAFVVSPRDASPSFPPINQPSAGAGGMWNVESGLMFSPRDAFAVPLECVSAFAVVLQGRIRAATFAR